MSQFNLDSIVRAAAMNLEKDKTAEINTRTEAEVDAQCWNRNDRLNMIAYEDQQ
jgi:hypothetical protein